MVVNNNNIDKVLIKVFELTFDIRDRHTQNYSTLEENRNRYITELKHYFNEILIDFHIEKNEKIYAAISLFFLKINTGFNNDNDVYETLQAIIQIQGILNKSNVNI